MGTSSTKLKREIHEKEEQARQDCLRTPTILRQILEQFCNAELMELSLVNKLWNFEARSVMKERGTLIANTWPFEDDDELDPCQKLVAFASDLDKMRVIPFLGIYVDMHHRATCRSISNRSLDPAYDVILSRLPWKYFAVSFCQECPQCETCSVLGLVEKVLTDYCGVLEELSLQYGREEFYQGIFHDRTFPCLKILKVEPGDFDPIDEHLTGGFMKALVSRAPRLQELHFDGDINFDENILEGSSAVLVPTRPFCPLFDHVCEGLIGSLRVNAMEIFIENEEVDLNLFNKFIPMVLVASHSTLRTLDVDVLCFIHLLRCRICLENVTSLHVYMNGNTQDNTEPFMGVKIPNGLNFPRVFPKLKKRTVSDYYDQGHRFILFEFSQSVVP